MPILLDRPAVTFGSGEQNRITLGSGLAVPVGIEAELEYGALLFNTRTMDRIRVTDIDGLIGGDIRAPTETNPSDDGETPFDAYYGGKNITLAGKIEGQTLEKMRDLAAALNAAFIRLVEQPLIFHTNNPARDFQIMCRKTAISIPDSQKDWTWRRDFNVTLHATNPRLVSVSQIITTILLSETVLMKVNNLGTYSAQPRIKFYGPMDAPVLTNYTSGRQIRFRRSVLAGEVITMDLARKQMTDQDGNLAFGRLDPTSDKMRIEPGQNEIEIVTSGTDSASTLTVVHRHTWV